MSPTSDDRRAGRSAITRPRSTPSAGRMPTWSPPMTMTYANEAIGIARAAAEGRHAGRHLLHGRDRRPAADRPDPEGCDTDRRSRDRIGADLLHDQLRPPDAFRSCPRRRRDWIQRIQGLRANASTLSHAELDDAPNSTTAIPSTSASAMPTCAGQPQLTVMGGCCGTDHRHVREICLACVAA